MSKSLVKVEWFPKNVRVVASMVIGGGASTGGRKFAISRAPEPFETREQSETAVRRDLAVAVYQRIMQDEWT